MKILVTGATGLVGKKLLETLVENNYSDIRILTTNKARAKSSLSLPVEIMQWNPLEKTIDDEALENIDIVFHLAGESVADGRWTETRKKKILNSRVLGTNLLIEAIKKAKTTPKKFISSSAIGIYETGFLADVCQKWEDELFSCGIQNMKMHALRTGIVLSSEGGALTKMLPPFKMGVGGILGSGKQFMNWIHIQDLANAFVFIMKNELENQAYNGVAPEPQTNKEFTKVLGKVLRRPTVFPIPAFMLKILFGEMSQILLEGKKATPEDLLKDGFKFKYSELQTALEEILNSNKEKENQ